MAKNEQSRRKQSQKGARRPPSPPASAPQLPSRIAQIKRCSNPQALQRGRIVSLQAADGYGFLRPLEEEGKIEEQQQQQQQQQQAKQAMADLGTSSDGSKTSKNGSVYFRLPPADLGASTSCHAGLMELRIGDTMEFMADRSRSRAQYSRLLEISARNGQEINRYLLRLLSLCTETETDQDSMAMVVLRELVLVPWPLRLILSEPAPQDLLLALEIAISISAFCCATASSLRLHSAKFKDFVSIFTRSPSAFFGHICTVLQDLRSDGTSSSSSSSSGMDRSSRSPLQIFQRHSIPEQRSRIESLWGRRGRPLHTLPQAVKDFVLSILRVLPAELPQLRCTIQILDGISRPVEEHLPQLRRSKWILGGISTPPVAEHRSDTGFALQVVGVLADSKGIGSDDDPRHIQWSKLPLVPLMPELTTVLDRISSTVRLPSAKLDGGYDRTEDYIDTYFRLLREDSFASLKKGISDFIGGKLDHRDMAVWSGVSVLGVHFSKSTPGMTLGLLLNQKQANRRSAKPPLSGSLLCICDSGGSFLNPIWAIAEKCEESKKKTVLFVDVLDSFQGFSGTDDSGSLAPWARLLHAENLVVAESPAYYRAYEPVLKSLQYLDPNTMPFQEELVHVKSPRKAPAYLDSSTLLDWRCLHASGRNAYGSLRAGADELTAKSLGGFETSLDPTQVDAVNHVLENRVAMIQGPPGTGKTFLSTKIVELLLSADTRKDKPILVMTYKNMALDQFLERCLEFCPPQELVRVGGGRKSNALADCNLVNILNQPGKHGLSADEIANRDVLGNLQIECQKALMDLYQCKKLSTHAITLNPLLRGFLHKLVFPREQNMQTTKVNCNDSDLQSSEMQDKLSKILKDWMPPQNVFRSVQACLLSVQQISIPKAAPASQIGREKESYGPGNDKKEDEDMEDSEEEADRKDSEDLLHKIKGKLQGNWLANDFLSLQDVPGNETIKGISLVNFDPAGYSWLLDADPWELSNEQRCIMMLLMMKANLEESIKQFARIKEQYDQLCKENAEFNKQKRVAILKNAKIVGMTTTGAAMNQDVLAAVSPSIILVEECGEILEPQLMAVLSPSVEHLILVGDHKQLRPSVNSYELVKNHNLGISMLERLAMNNLPFQTLGLQSRMREEFLQMVAPMYPALKSNKEVVNGPKNQPAKCMNSTMYFWNHSSQETQGRSPSNVHEGHMVVALSKWLLAEGLNHDEISVICAYNGQVTLLRQLLTTLGEGNTAINVQTIDRFQGSENRVVIVSTVRSNAQGIIGHLKEANRLCVTVSRARSGFYVCGNAKTLSKKSKEWRRLIEGCFQKQDLLGETIFLTCPRHPSDPSIELHHKDAEKFSATSVCKRSCNAVLECLHRCQTTCHGGAHPPCKEKVLYSFNTCEHATIKFCSASDSDMKCHEEVWLTLDTCGHSIKCKCWERTEKNSRAFSCTYPCDESLPCGHPCTLRCSIPCSSKPCPTCDEIKRIQVEKEKELHRKRLAEKLENIDLEIRKLENRTSDGPFFKELLPEGETAAEYCMVKDRTEKFIQLDHMSLPIVRRVEKVTNLNLEVAFLKAQKDLIDPTAPTQLLFHGTSDEGVQGITQNGFLLPPLSADNMFGQGCYFATDSSKSAQSLYTKGSNKLLLCEVLLGVPWSVNTAKKDLNLEAVRKKGYDSVFSMRNSTATQGTKYDEYIVYDPRQAIPRYVIHYGNMKCSDPEMQNLLLSQPKVAFERRLLNASSSSTFNGLTADEMHYRFAESQFLRMYNSNGGSKKIKEVEYTRCSDLEERYEASKKEMGARTETVNERLLFHGTSNEAIDKIIREGFKVGGQEVAIRTGSVYGKGVYVAANPETAMAYARDSKMMLLSLAVCGEFGVDHKFGGSTDIFVLTKGSQLLPRYIVHFN